MELQLICELRLGLVFGIAGHSYSTVSRVSHVHKHMQRQDASYMLYSCS
jgi:hypothetical protein